MAKKATEGGGVTLDHMDATVQGHTASIDNMSETLLGHAKQLEGLEKTVQHLDNTITEVGKEQVRQTESITVLVRNTAPLMGISEDIGALRRSALLIGRGVAWAAGIITGVMALWGAWVWLVAVTKGG